LEKAARESMGFYAFSLHPRPQAELLMHCNNKELRFAPASRRESPGLVILTHGLSDGLKRFMIFHRIKGDVPF
jgi:hypothetical protein